MLHGFLSYLVKCAITGRPYTIFGYKGKQVRDNIHSFDLINMFWQFYQAPRPGEVYNAGGGRHSNCSMQEAIALCEEMAGKKMNVVYSEQNRIGDHIWYISDTRKFQSHYPAWSYTLRSRSHHAGDLLLGRQTDLMSRPDDTAWLSKDSDYRRGGFRGVEPGGPLQAAVSRGQIIAFDNLHRRGSELNLPRLQEAGVRFPARRHPLPGGPGRLGDFDLLIDCAAEPSVQAGAGGSPCIRLKNNLVGTIHCLEAAARARAAFLLLSTSRVYPIGALNGLPFARGTDPFSLDRRGRAGRHSPPRASPRSFPSTGHGHSTAPASWPASCCCRNTSTPPE